MFGTAPLRAVSSRLPENATPLCRGLDQLLEIKRNASGLGENGLQLHGVDSAALDCRRGGGQLSSIGGVQLADLADRDMVGMAAIGIDQSADAEDLLGGAAAVGAQGDHDESLCVLRPIRQPIKQQFGGRIDPLHILEHDRCGVIPAAIGEPVDQRLDRQVPLHRRPDGCGRVTVIELDTEEIGDQRHALMAGWTVAEQLRRACLSFAGGLSFATILASRSRCLTTG